MFGVSVINIVQDTSNSDVVPNPSSLVAQRFGVAPAARFVPFLSRVATPVAAVGFVIESRPVAIMTMVLPANFGV